MEILEPGFYYHIYNHGNGCEDLFLNDDNYNFFLKKYTFYISSVADTFAYCLMPNHFHFLVRINEINSKTSEVLKTSEVSNTFKNFFISYTKAFNKVNNRNGSLFRPKFQRKRIIDEEYLKNSIVYIHLNPVYHEFVNKPKKWKYSSYKSFFSLKTTSLKKKEVLSWFEDVDNFKAYHNLKSAEYYATKMGIEF